MALDAKKDHPKPVCPRHTVFPACFQCDQSLIKTALADKSHACANFVQVRGQEKKNIIPSMQLTLAVRTTGHQATIASCEAFRAEAEFRDDHTEPDFWLRKNCFIV